MREKKERIWRIRSILFVWLNGAIWACFIRGENLASKLETGWEVGSEGGLLMFATWRKISCLFLEKVRRRG